MTPRRKEECHKIVYNRVVIYYKEEDNFVALFLLIVVILIGAFACRRPR